MVNFFMKCYFCQTEINESAIAEKGPNFGNPFFYGACHKCQHNCITSYRDGKIIVASITFVYKDRTFLAKFNFTHSTFSLTPWITSDEGLFLPQRCILSLDFIPHHITPVNILDKMPTLILFS